MEGITTDPHHVIEHPENQGRNVTLICGPPGAGKTTLALTLHPQTLDIGDMAPGTPRERMKAYGRAAYRIGRNTAADIAVVRCAPTETERARQQELTRPARTIILLTDADTCHQRITQRNRTEDSSEGRGLESQAGAVVDWWAKWEAPRPIK
jgi:GTPase SAR1 family protein